MSRKRKSESGLSSSCSGMNAGDFEASRPSTSKGISRAGTVAPAVLTAKHRASIDFALAKLLETVGDYELEVRLQFHLRSSASICIRACHRKLLLMLSSETLASVKNLSSMTSNKSFILVHDLLRMAAPRSTKPLGVEMQRPCNRLLLPALDAIAAAPATLISIAVAHCVGLSAPEWAMPASEVSLFAYQLGPSFFWAPRTARAAIFVWARDAFIVQLAANTEQFAALSDDCAGDVLEFIELGMPRSEALHIATYCSSPEAHSWVRAVAAKAVVVRIKNRCTTPTCFCIESFSHLYTTSSFLSFWYRFFSTQSQVTKELKYAAKKGDLEAVQDCLAKGANIDAQSEVRCYVTIIFQIIVYLLLLSIVHGSAGVYTIRILRSMSPSHIPYPSLYHNVRVYLSFLLFLLLVLTCLRV